MRNTFAITALLLAVACSAPQPRPGAPAPEPGVLASSALCGSDADCAALEASLGLPERIRTHGAPIPSDRAPGLNVNTATLDELDGLRGIGPVLAQRIIDGRPFKDAADLEARVRGIGPKTLAQLEPFLSFDAQ